MGLDGRIGWMERAGGFGGGRVRFVRGEVVEEGSGADGRGWGQDGEGGWVGGYEERRGVESVWRMCFCWTLSGAERGTSNVARRRAILVPKHDGCKFQTCGSSMAQTPM